MQKWIIIIVVLIIAILGGFIIFNVEVETEYVPEVEIEEKELRKTIVSLYFKNKENNSISEETRLIDSKELLKSPYETLLKLLMSGPENSNNVKIIPDNVKLLNVKYENGIVEIEFDEEFDRLNQEEKDLVFESIYNTLIKLTEVTNIKILTTSSKENNINTNSINDKNLENTNVISNVV